MKRVRRLLLCVGLSSCNVGSSGPATTSGTTGGDASSSGVEDMAGRASDQCERAPVIEAGLHRDTLANRSESLGGACGGGGEDAFFAIEVPWRSDLRLTARGRGFEPRLGVLPRGCVHGWDDLLACGQGVELWLSELEPGTQLAVAIGRDENAPVASVEDPLAFELEVHFRQVLAEGEICSPAGRGRCESGTVCASDGAGDEAVSTCVAVVADVCADALSVAMTMDPTELFVPAESPHTDAHHHTCGGARRPERVFSLEGEALAPGRRLVVTPLHADVVLAVRTGSCLASSEVGCSPPGGEAVEIVTRGEPIYLFVELPAPAEPRNGQPWAKRELAVVSLQLTDLGEG